LRKRFYHLAFELGVTPRTFIRDLANAGLSVGNQMVVIPERLEAHIRETYEKLRPVGAPEPEPALEPIEEEVALAPEPSIEDVVHEMPPVVEPEPMIEVEPEEQEVEVEAGVQATPVSASSGDGTAQAAPPRRDRRRAGEPPRSAADLVPTIDPRAGRLVKDAPRAGVPGVTGPRGRVQEPTLNDLNPTIPQSQRAPGARRESHRRSAVPEEFRGKHGKETFHLRKRPRTKSRAEPVHVKPKSFEVEPPISVKKFSELSALKAADVIKVLFKNHKMLVTTNSMLDQDAIEILAIELDLDIKFTKTASEEEQLIESFEQKDAPEDLVSRPPVVTILGHVDHGKTTLLDKIRESDVAAKEAGGITQHIGASQVAMPDGRRVTFIDTPGHEAFTEMRARGAQVTDVVILVVAADDGVMPQTVEAISHARVAEVPIVVAITKCDKQGADPNRVRQQLTEHNVFVEGWGGDTSCFEVSAVTGKGVPEMLEHLALLSEVEAERFSANPSRLAEGTVIESENSPKRGVVATVLVQNGTLRRGDAVLAGEAFGTVRALHDPRGRTIEEAGPGDPVELIGLDQAPDAGSKFYVLEDMNRARDIAQERRVKTRERELASQSKPTTVESLLGAIDQGKVKELNVVLKTDVKGSLEPIRGLLDRLGTEEVRVKVVHAAVGAVNESDVILANASSAWIIGFSVNIDEKARMRAKMLGVDIHVFRVIYEIEELVRGALEGKLAPEIREAVIGHVEVQKVFASSRLGNIAGCRVKDGVVRRDAFVRVMRGEQQLHEARIASLRREKDEAREVKEGFECGIRLEGWDAFQEGDVFEVFSRESVARKLG
jgi:translation initiation factor IF-2